MDEVGAAEWVAPRVRHVLAPNPGMMTGPGTNTYIVGRSELAVVDPGPADDSHLDAVVAAAGGPIRWIMVTHTHPDHAPGADGLRRRTGAEVLGFGPRDGFRPDRLLGEGDAVEAAGFRLEALHTPGHASNHLCYLLAGEGLLFSGDHVMDGSTVVISPLDGDMADYLRSLQRLQCLDPPLRAIAPGHGSRIDDPAERLEGYLEHRLERERLVLAALVQAGEARAAELVGTVYADVDDSRHEVARRSLWAHLRKLAADGRATSDDPDDEGARWRPV